MQSPDFAGWFRYGSADSPDYGSIGTALGTSHVIRHHDAGFVQISGVGKISYQAGIESGWFDEAAVTAIKAHPHTFGRPPVPYVAPEAPKRRGPAYEGTPAGDVIEAMLHLQRSPGDTDRAAALAKALDAAITAGVQATLAQQGAN